MQPVSAKAKAAGAKRVLLELTVREGKNREIRRMLAKLHLPVRRLIRTHIGPIHDDRLKPGKSRRLREAEISAIRKLAQENAQAGKPARRPRKTARRRPRPKGR